MNIGQKTRTYTIEPVQTPVPAERDQEQEETEPERPLRNAPTEPTPTAPER
jgi:hypothetical protein